MAKEIKYEAALAELQTIVHKMENDELDIDQMSEQLKRGYSITLRNGHLLRNAAEVEPGTELETRLEQGTIISIVK